MSKKINISPTKQWPQDWYKHIVNTSLLYFEDTNIKLERKVIFNSEVWPSFTSSDGTKQIPLGLQLDFSINDDENYDYIATLRMPRDEEDNNIIQADVCYIEEEEIIYEISPNGSHIFDSDFKSKEDFNTKEEYGCSDELIIVSIGETIRENNPYDCIKKIEEIIIYDYENRDDDDDDDYENIPEDITPPSTSGVKPYLIGA
jgi:hypothetical protein